MRACREVQVNDVIGMALSQYRREDLSSTSMIRWELRTCVACGECVQACPTGALMPKSIVDPLTQRGDSGGGPASRFPFAPIVVSAARLHIKSGTSRIAFVQGRNGPANESRLCVKGRFGFDYVTNPQRLMKPLIRKPGLPKRLDVDPSNPLTHFREASWEEALGVSRRRAHSRSPKKHGNKSIAGFGSAK